MENVGLSIMDTPATAAHTAPDLTPQQRRVLNLVSEGLLNKQIAYKLGISASTVKAHVSAAYKALGVSTRVAAVRALIGPARA